MMVLGMFVVIFILFFGMLVYDGVFGLVMYLMYYVYLGLWMLVLVW